MLAVVVGVLVASVGARAAVEPYVVCAHVPITGAAPVPHHPARFGAFYFDAVNAELGGIDGHPVTFLAWNDEFTPAGAERAVEKCRQAGAHLIVGSMGIDQMARVAAWAEEAQIPYLHGSMAGASVEGLTWSAFIGPTDEEQMAVLARTIAAEPSDVPRAVGMVSIDSPYYDPGREAFRAALAEHDTALAVDTTVQKDESQFEDVWFELQSAHVRVVNMYVTPSIWIRMLNQKPLTYSPTLTSISINAGFEIVAAAAKGVPAFTFHEPSPAYDRDDLTLPWRAEIEEFHRIFDTYSPEHDPPRDDFDWLSYLRAKQIHRFLDALDGDVSPDHIRSSWSSYAEDPEQAYPSCALDFTATPRRGAHAWHLLQAQNGTWTQAGTCLPGSPADLTPPDIDCGDDLQVATDVGRCILSDPGSGVGPWMISSAGNPLGSTQYAGDGGCAAQVEIPLDLGPGPHRLTIRAENCGAIAATRRVVVVSATA